MKTAIINLYGAPCTGKSTTACGLFYEMKKRHYNVELALEWIKFKVYEDTPYPFQDQLYTFANQNKLIKLLNDKVDYIITDSPLLLSLIYNDTSTPIFKNLVKEVYKSYNNLNFLLERNFPYSNYGRRENESQSNVLQKRLMAMLYDNDIPFMRIKSDTAVKDIMDMIKEEKD